MVAYSSEHHIGAVRIYQVNSFFLKVGTAQAGSGSCFPRSQKRDLGHPASVATSASAVRRSKTARGNGSRGLFRIKGLISSRRQRRLSPSAAATSCEVEFAGKEKRERLNGEVCASLYRITVGKRKLWGLSIAHLTIYLKASEMFRYRS